MIANFSSLFRTARVIGACIAMHFSGQAAYADLWWPALGWSCDEDARHLAIYPVYFDANEPLPVSRDGFYVPMADGWDNPKAEVPVFFCDLSPGPVVEVIRIGSKVPSARGVCGAGAYSRYSLRLSGEVSAQFAIGCSANTFVKIDQNYGQLCNVSLPDDPCRSLRAGTFFILNAFGQFEERQR